MSINAQRPAVLLSALAFATLVASSPASAEARGAASYAQLQHLEGDWVLTAEQEGEAARHPVIAPLVGSGKVALSYRLVGSKTTLQENIFPGTPREMATMYHCLDAACTEVIADHYCSLKNQPVLRAEPRVEEGKLVFRCDPALAVCNSPAAHLDVLTIELPRSPAEPLKTTFALRKDGKPGEVLVFRFDRKPTTGGQ